MLRAVRSGVGPRGVCLTFVRMTVALTLAAAACHGPRSGAPALSPSELRALLLAPESGFWREPAPEHFTVSVETTRGTFTIAVDRALAPRGADRFYRLVQAGYFDDSRFSRVVPGFIAQFGIPGDPAITRVWKDRALDDDSVRTSNVRGTIAYAMTGPNTRTTQLFISLVDNTRLDAQGFAPIGRVVTGMDVVDRLYGGYGESSGGGMRAGNQGRVLTEGNAYLDREYPLLDRILRIRLGGAQGPSGAGH
jgi:homoserine O-acetyltransferase/O-succinyltransferase